MSAVLHVLLGDGGVGKTTLAAGYALALARAGRRVGLLGIDPSRRLQGALGVHLQDEDAIVPRAGELRAAVLQPEACMRRWADQTCADSAARERLTLNAFFVTLADRLATSTDLLAAVRVAEWLESDPRLEHLVIDTAPGLDAIEFLRRPGRLAAFLEGHLVGWLRTIGATETHGRVGSALRGASRRVIGGLARIGGTRLLVELADFAWLARDLFALMLARVERVQRWLSAPSTEILLVTAVAQDAARRARQLAEALDGVGLTPRAVLVNRAVPASLAGELAALEATDLPPEGAPLVRYTRAYAKVQAELVGGVARLAPRVTLIEAVRGLDGDDRIEALAALGERLRIA